jgi:hypothetical protein
MVERFMSICKKTQSADHFKKRSKELEECGIKPDGTKDPSKALKPQGKRMYPDKINYDHLVCDPCYRYNKSVKE